MIASAPDRTVDPLNAWMARRSGMGIEALTCESVREYQLKWIRRTITWARDHSAFYAARLAGFAQEWPQSMEEFAQAPFTSPCDIVENGHAFLCVPQSEISRVVSLETSGTSGAPKRIFFTAADQDHTLDFFARGVLTMAQPHDRMFIGLPGESEGSVGYQLARGMERAGLVPIAHGMISDPAAALARMDEEKATLLIGIPVQVLALALETGEVARSVFRRLHTIVLCSDHVPQSLVERIRRATGCEVFEHYGSTEMGLGGGLDCRAHAGYHLREADLYFEIVSPWTGLSVKDGVLGEVVFTTLSRNGMPLLRYRTGDLARIVPAACSCGSVLRRMARIENRNDSFVFPGRAGGVTISALDEVLFALPGVLNFTATLVIGKRSELTVCISTLRAHQGVCEAAGNALSRVPAIALNLASGELRLQVLEQREPFPSAGSKRKIAVIHS